METTRPANRSFALRLNIGLLKLSRHWLRVALIIVGTYVTLPFVAPTLMHLGLTAPAQVLYTAYSPFCHQFAFRTFFLFGEQVAYPRAAAETDLKPFEAYIRDSAEFEAIFDKYNASGAPFDPSLFTPQLQFAAREFVGNPQMGYKVTLCERDITIYIMIFVGGLLYAIPFVRRRLRPIPIGLYLLLGLGPIAIDGLSQLLSYPPFSLWEPRETTPFFRVLTGATFGFMNAWLGFPYLEMTFRDTQEQLEDKLAQAGIRV